MRLLRPLRVTAETPSSELLREALQRAALSGALFAVLMLLGHGIAYAVSAGVGFAVFMGGFFVGEIFWRRQLARRRAATGEPDPPPPSERPAYYPPFWPDDALTRWTMATPRRALVHFAIPGVLFGGLLFWRVADSPSFSTALGEGTGAIVLVAGPLGLGFSWYFGVRAWAALRGSDG